MDSIDFRWAEVALPTVDTTAFEKFGQIFYSEIQDKEFVPLGGMHDGGAEGFDSFKETDPELFFDKKDSFLQISKQATIREKVKSTVKRLIKYGRKPRILTYLSSLPVRDIDKEEKLLSDELGCIVRIRDAAFIVANINSTPAIRAAFRSYLEPAISYLYRPGASNLGAGVSEFADRTLAVFLRQEVDNRKGRSGLLEAVADSLILWALGETDPEKRIFLTKKELVDKVEKTLPAAKQFFRGVIDARLEKLASKGAEGGRKINWYRKENKYCLPFETRQLVAAENAEDDTLKLRVAETFFSRLADLAEGDDAERYREYVVEVCNCALERVFSQQGLEVARFVTNDVNDEGAFYPDIEEIVAKQVDKLALDPLARAKIRRYSLSVLRGTFYQSTQDERTYLQKLSKTYILLLLVKNEPRILEHFKSMAGSLRLYIGTDLIVRAFSEQFLSKSDQMTVNLLSILKSCGAELVITETVAEEIETHLRAQILEFENFYQGNEHKLTAEVIHYIDRILIRAYFYARLRPVSGVTMPNKFQEFIGQFADYNDIRALKARDALTAYLVRRFQASFESKEEMLKGVDLKELEVLANDISEARLRSNNSHPEIDRLSHNDALQILRVFSRRKEGRERDPQNNWGYKTWWLTQDGKARRAGSKSSAARGGAQFMMRPEFLLAYVSFAPKMAEIHESYNKIFPSVLGVRLSSRLPNTSFMKVMKEANEVATYDDARASVMITQLTERLKGDALKRYENPWESQF